MTKLTLSKIVILLLDDHALFREGVSRLLSAEPSLEVVQSGSVADALAILGQRRVDIVLLDFDLGGQDGVEFMSLARQQGFAGKVLVVTAGVEDDTVAKLIQTGISGIFMKHHSAALLEHVILHVLGGEVWFDQELLRGAMARAASPHKESPTPFTQRERQVLSFVFEGLANKEIASRIGVSESAVKASLQQLFSKTGVRTRSQLVRIALERYKNNA